MTRSVWKGPFVDSHLLKKVKAAGDGGKGGQEIIKERINLLLREKLTKKQG